MYPYHCLAHLVFLMTGTVVAPLKVRTVSPLPTRSTETLVNVLVTVVAKETSRALTSVLTIQQSLQLSQTSTCYSGP